MFICENAKMKGCPNVTAGRFCQCVNEDLLVNTTLEPSFPQKIAVETTKKWMHELGFSVVHKKKGTLVDSHERDDVMYRNKFLQRMASLSFLNSPNAPTDEALNALPSDLEASDSSIIKRTIVLFQNESTFQANCDQPTIWVQPETSVMSKGSGIMVSDFIKERAGYLQLFVR